MKRLSVMALALFGAGTSSFAADLAAKAPPPKSAPIVASNWQGFYAGVAAGAAFDGSSVQPLLGGDFLVYQSALRKLQYEVPLGGAGTVFTGGIYGGYNWQFNTVVVGLEADINYADRKTMGLSVQPSLADPTVTLTRVYGTAGNWFGTVRGRLGWAFDKALIYATGGLAYGNTGAGYYAGGNGYNWLGRDQGVNWGWTVGGGGEYRLDSHWSVRAEYLYVSFQSDSFALRFVPTAPFVSPTFVMTGTAEYNLGVARGGLTYKF
ncbi:porin family protein [Aquabacter sp. L1I39]|uniref:outer membrane protein n=1 Tax=Aquabacter sp. L1I39 TaxID=2820278 RepID=UPI001ADD2382|nr:outer membrane beta-barrel protein [Aquabacter sp. L1I39]QTL01560.1 porin family protein [Aquabacter sp. L1I39]